MKVSSGIFIHSSESGNEQRALLEHTVVSELLVPWGRVGNIMFCEILDVK
jgi:hypothetical protein